MLGEFFVLVDGVWSHKRADKELERYKAKASLASFAGKASAVSRLNKTAPTDVQRTFNGRSTDVQRTLPQTSTDVEKTSTDVQPTKNQEPITNNQVIPPTPFEGEVAAVAAPRVRKSAWGDPLDGLPAVLNVPEFVNVWLEYIAYRKKQSAKTLPSRTRVFAKAVEVGVPAAIAGMIQSMEKGWSGIHIETKTNAKLEKRSGECPESLDVPVF